MSTSPYGISSRMKLDFNSAAFICIFSLWNPCCCDDDYTVWKATAFTDEFISLSASLLDFGPILTAASLLKNCLPTMNMSTPVFANTDLSPFDDLVKTHTFNDPIIQNLLVVGFEFIYALQRQVSDPYFLAAYNVSDLMVKADRFFEGIKGGLFPYDPYYDWSKVEANGKVLSQIITDFLLSGILDVSGLRAIIRTDKVNIIGIMTYLKAIGLPFREDLPSIIIHSADLYFLLPTWEALAPADPPIGCRDGILPAIIFSVADNVKQYGILLNLRTSYWVGNQLMNICPGCTAASQALFESCVRDDAAMANVVAKMTEMLDGQIMSIYVAPPCRLELLATTQLAGQYNITMVTGSGELIGNSSKFPYTIRTAFSPVWFWEGFVEFSKGFNWTNFFILYDDMSTGLADPMTKIINAEGLMTMLHSHNMNGILVRHHTMDDVLPNLLLLQKSARIAVLLFNKEILRFYMLRAYDMGMCDGTYAFISYQSFEDLLTDEFDYASNSTGTYYDALAMLTRRLKLAVAAGVPLSKPDNMTYLEFTTILTSFITSPSFSGKELVIEQGMTGPIVFDSNGNRHADTVIMDMRPEGTHEPAVNFYSGNRSQEKIFDIIWPNNAGPPPDKPYCGYEGENPACAPLSMNSLISIVATCTSLSAAIAFIILWQKRTRRQYKGDRKWIARFSDLQYPRDVHDWVRRRYTLIDDGAGGLAVPDAIRRARRAMATAGSVQSPDLEDGQNTTLLQASASQNRFHAVYQKTPVTVRTCLKKELRVTANVVKEVKTVRVLENNENTIRFIAASVERHNVAIFYEYCAKGCLQDLLSSPQFRLDWTMRLTVIADILRGVAHLHSSPLHTHGRLTSRCCYVDSRFVLKIGDFGLPSFFALTPEETQDAKDSGELWDALLWTAPEHIGVILGGEMTNFARPTERRRSRRETAAASGLSKSTKKFLKDTEKQKSEGETGFYEQTVAAQSGSRPGDIYSIAIIMSEIFTGRKPYAMFEDLTSEEIALRVKDRLTYENPFRPAVSEEDCGPPALYNLLTRCWSDQYAQRPTLAFVRMQVKDIAEELGISGKASTIMDVMLNRMEELASELQATIAQKTRKVDEEKTRFFELAAEILPRSVAERLKHEENVSPETFDIVTLLVCDVVNFAQLTQDIQPHELLEMVTDLHAYYDAVVREYECIIVDNQHSVMILASGLPVRNGIFNAREIARAALTLLFRCARFTFRHRTSHRLRLRMAINTGPVVAGIIGEICPRYCIFGETIFVAHRLLAITKDFNILCSSTACNLMETFGSFVLVRQNDIFIKGKGNTQSFNLCGENANPAIQRLEADFRAVFPETASG